MNIIEQQLLEEVLSNPQSEREELLCLVIKSQRGAFTELEGIADWSEEDPEAGGTYHGLFDAIEVIQSVRSELSAMKQLAERLTKERFNKNDDLPDGDTAPLAYWFAVKVQGLEDDNACMAESALSVAIQAIKKLIRVEDELENLGG